jgi:predicted AAA+ superfamily ATPase
MRISYGMIKRLITTELIEAAREYPVVTVFGPRQSGKTTLSRMTFPDKPYYSLENPDLRMAAETDPKGFLSTLPAGAILDEIQRLPVLLSYIQGIVDEAKKPGMFILTGSHQPELHQSVSQSLAGRTALLNLLPFSYRELGNYRKDWNAFQLILTGFYPRVHEERLSPRRFFNGYLQTYIERDVRALINLKDLAPFQQFLALLAGRIGQIINYQSLSNDVGVSATTIKNWISVLKASFVVFDLPPFFENIRKRVVKSPKIYFCDPGLAAFLLNIDTREHLSRDPLRGGLFENLWILDVLKHRSNHGKRPELFFYRDTNGNEVDLIVRHGRQLIPVEIKSAATFTPEFLKGIERFKKVAGDRCLPGLVLYNGDERLSLKGINIINPILHNGLGTI